MENLCSSSSQPSGVRLLALLQGQWKEILRREESNVSLMHLYGTGTHWVAFERSACQLSRLCTEAKIVPMRLSGFPFPVVMATFSQAQSEHFIHDLPKVEEGIDRLSFKMPVLRKSMAFGMTGRLNIFQNMTLTKTKAKAKMLLFTYFCNEAIKE